MMKHTQTIFGKVIIEIPLYRDYLYVRFFAAIHDLCIWCMYRDLQYWRRGYSSIASSPLSSAVKQGWAKQDGLALFGAFFGGFSIHSCISKYMIRWVLLLLRQKKKTIFFSINSMFSDIYKRRKHWYKVENLSKKNDKRFEEVMTKSFQWMTVRNPFIYYLFWYICQQMFNHSIFLPMF